MIIDAQSRIFGVVRANDSRHGTTDLVQVIDKHGLSQPAEIAAKLSDELAVVPSIVGIAIVRPGELTAVRFGPIEIAVFGEGGERFTHMRSLFQLWNSPQFCIGMGEYTRVSPSRAQRIARGHLRVDDEEEVATVTLPLDKTARWIVIATAICFHIIPPERLRAILRGTADEIAVDIRNWTIASGFEGTVSVVVVDLRMLGR
jgi:hypothetical protein